MSEGQCFNCGRSGKPTTAGMSFLGSRAAYDDEIATVAEPTGASVARSARRRWTGSYRSVQLTKTSH